MINRKKYLFAMMAIVMPMCGCVNASTVQTAEADPWKSRTFRMALTPFPYDITPDSAAQTNSYISKNADAILYHLDQGVPWEQALLERPYPEAVEREISSKLNDKPAQCALVLMTSPLNGDRSGLAGTWDTAAHQPRTGVFADKTFDDPTVVETYIKYCTQLIERFNPAYFVYAVEVNVLLDKDSAQWNAFSELCRQTYAALKKTYPDLPVLFSIEADNFHNSEALHRKRLAQIMDYTDCVSISCYPFAFSGHPDPDTLPDDFFSKIRTLAPGKPFAIAETGFTAESLSITGLKITGSPENQRKYVAWMLDHAQREKAEFICWYIVRDYDKLWAAMSKAGAIEWYVLWKDCGLFDGEGQARPAYDVWREWFLKPWAQ